ncbi:hypothetical protein AAFF_G00117270 [Aldrovandia affinis]|uniref:Uncharacterized protein n=1 Tax=Aldrovandia affinis TaxID=143900 RepID=A0AAD7T3I7_9TELE|nr:hypothetical protein AAFF_G00117270 [Aldrovandia affinis]
MAVQNYVMALNEFAQRSRLILKYEDVSTDGPDHLRTFTIRVVMGDQIYPEGVGLNKKEAKQNAAKNAFDAIDAIDGGSIQQNLSVCRPECASPHPVQGPITQPNYVCWLNEYCQKRRLTIKPIESTMMNITNITYSCRYVVGGSEFPETFGSTRKEAKEEAAKAVYQEVCREPIREEVDEKQKEGAIGQKEVLSQSVSTPCSSAPETPSMKHETNCMGLLNHHCQKNKTVHDYKLIDKRGPAHSPFFVYKVVIDKKEYPEGEGNTAKEAKQHAAQLAWDALQQPDWSSQASSRSTVSEDSTSSPSSKCDSEDKIETENKAKSTSESIIFKDSSNVNNPKMAYNPEDVKPKRRSAPRFSMGNNNDQERGTPLLKNNNLPEKTNQKQTQYYDKIQPIGKGGFGRVFKARKKIENKYVAVKIVKNTEKALREINALSDLQHPNIVRYYHAWIEDTR